MGELEKHVLRSRLAGRHDAHTYAELVDHGWTPSDVRLALLRAPRAPEVRQGTPGTSTTGPSGARRWALVASVVLATIPTAAVAVVAAPITLSAVVLFTGGPLPWDDSTWKRVESLVVIAPWLLSAYVVALVLLLVDVTARRPLDPWGRPLRSVGSTRALRALSIGMLALAPLLAVGGFMLFVITGVVCGETPSTCR